MENVMTDYSFWRKALQEGVVGSIVEDEPQPGFYKVKTKDGFDPVSIWYENDQPVVLRDGLEVEGDLRWEVWMRCAKRPIAHETYNQRIETGKWPSDLAAPEPTYGHNSGSVPDTEVIGDQLADVSTQASEWLAGIGNKVTTQDQADKAANFANRYAELERAAEDKRKAEKEPHLKAGRDIDEKWRPIVDRAKGDKAFMKEKITDFLIAEKAKREGSVTEGTEGVSPKAGTRGRSIALRTPTEVTCTDADTLWSFYKDDKRLRSPEVCRRLMELAQIDLEAGKDVKGAKLVKVEKAA